MQIIHFLKILFKFREKGKRRKREQLGKGKREEETGSGKDEVEFGGGLVEALPCSVQGLRVPGCDISTCHAPWQLRYERPLDNSLERQPGYKGRKSMGGKGDTEDGL